MTADLPFPITRTGTPSATVSASPGAPRPTVPAGSCGSSADAGTGQDLTLLWALRSPCNLGCRYCYFGTLEEHRDAPPTAPGVLSHLPHGDLPLDELMHFLSTVEHSRVGRVFLAGGEPLIWPGFATLLRRLHTAQVQTVVCTNGIPLTRPEVRADLLEHADSVSVSLDAAAPELNDHYRPARNGKDGWHSVVAGLRALLADRSAAARGPRVGVYAVLTRATLPELDRLTGLVTDLGVDYFVPQPISLSPEHPLHAELSFDATDAAHLQAALTGLRGAADRVALPDQDYARRVAASVTHELGRVSACFGGDQLSFVEPDGSVWDCPSRHRVAAQAHAGTQRSIAGTTAADLFPSGRRPGPTDCALFSSDCVNMWPLMRDFDRFLAAGPTTRPAS